MVAALPSGGGHWLPLVGEGEEGACVALHAFAFAFVGASEEVGPYLGDNANIVKQKKKKMKLKAYSPMGCGIAPIKGGGMTIMVGAVGGASANSW